MVTRTFWALLLGLLVTFTSEAEAPKPATMKLNEIMHDPAAVLPPVRTITRGPKFHWFGYYDKYQFDSSQRYVLSMEVDFEHRSPKPDDAITVGMVDLQDNDTWIPLGTSTAWCWQQGCMLQWRPGSDTEVLWNDCVDGRLVCHVIDVKTREKRTLPHAIYHVSPDGQWALGTDFARTADMRPGYGYNSIPDPNKDVLAPADSGIYKMNLDTGEYHFLISVADVAKIPYPNMDPTVDKHYFNHIQWNTDGSRFLFLNRQQNGSRTRMFTAAPDGSDIRFVDNDASHFVWHDPEYITVWIKNEYRIYKDDASSKYEVLWREMNGHQSYLPGNEWLITDTYPWGGRREQQVYLYHLPTGRIVPVGNFASPKEYTGEWRCDTHPRVSRDGTLLTIDSPHGGEGRQLHLIDISGIVGKELAPPRYP